MSIISFNPYNNPVRLVPSTSPFQRQNHWSMVSEVGYKPQLANLLSKTLSPCPDWSQQSDLLGGYTARTWWGWGSSRIFLILQLWPLTDASQCQNPLISILHLLFIQNCSWFLCLTGCSFLRPTFGSSGGPDFWKRAHIPETKHIRAGRALDLLVQASLSFIFGGERETKSQREAVTCPGLHS